VGEGIVPVIPAKAGIQANHILGLLVELQIPVAPTLTLLHVLGRE